MKLFVSIVLLSLIVLQGCSSAQGSAAEILTLKEKCAKYVSIAQKRAENDQNVQNEIWDYELDKGLTIEYQGTFYSQANSTCISKTRSYNIVQKFEGIEFMDEFTGKRTYYTNSPKVVQEYESNLKLLK